MPHTVKFNTDCVCYIPSVDLIYDPVKCVNEPQQAIVQ